MDASARNRPGRDRGTELPPRPRQAQQTQQPKREDARSEVLQKAQGRAKGLAAWWTKVNNDWVFNLSGLLAYNFLMSIFPILIVLLAIAGFVLGALDPHQLGKLEGQIGSALPGGGTILNAVFTQLNHSKGVLLIVGVVTGAFAGSRLFVTIDNCFSVIFRLRARDPIRQNLMAFGMLAIYIFLIPLVSLGPVIPSVIVQALGPAARTAAVSFFIQVIGIAISVAIAMLLFGIIYIVVPNRPVRIREMWKGTLVAAILLVIYDIAFPFYERLALHPGNYGSVAGFAIVILVFFYYLGFILLIGAEINSWAAGQRQTLGDIPAILHEVQAHDTTRGVAGPTAGLPQEDLQYHQGAEAMRDDTVAVEHERVDHAKDAKPTPPGEVHEPGPPHQRMPEREQEWHEIQGQLKEEHPEHEKRHRTPGDRDGSASGPASSGGASPSHGETQQTPEPSASSSRFAATSPEVAGTRAAVYVPPRPADYQRRARAASLALVVAAAAAMVPALTRLARLGQGSHRSRPVAA